MNEHNKPTIVAFDFDGTITNKDSFIEFIKFSKGKFQFYAGFLFFSPVLVAMKLRLVANWKVKQWVISYFFKGMTLQEFNLYCEKFSAKIDTMLQPKFAETLEKYKQNGYEICIVSASIENWLIPWAEKTGISTVLATKLEINKNQIITGRLLGKNCYGQEKVNRLLEVFPERETYYLIAYGDSGGDRELLAFADENYFRAFE
ncbi:MAG: HAD-IB family hydrolase [Bacteroidetes bacterium]|nr:HAD-IB family hydrolase [Bacteroidota bacterium]